jgi:hypothetical protein
VCGPQPLLGSHSVGSDLPALHGPATTPAALYTLLQIAAVPVRDSTLPGPGGVDSAADDGEDAASAQQASDQRLAAVDAALQPGEAALVKVPARVVHVLTASQYWPVHVPLCRCEVRTPFLTRRLDRLRRCCCGRRTAACRATRPCCAALRICGKAGKPHHAAPPRTLLLSSAARVACTR